LAVPVGDPSGSSADRLESPRSLTDQPPNCELLQFSNETIRFSVKTDRDRRLICNFWNDGNWIARVRNVKSGNTIDRPVQEMGEFHAGVLVPAGDCEITLLYQPTSFWIGAWVSGLSWSLLTLFGLSLIVKGQSKRQPG
jgi:hypothetical protein